MGEPQNAFAVLTTTVRNLRSITCAMRHERVRLNADGIPERRHVNIAHTDFVREGLCSWAMRSNSLTCAHTMARFVLADALAVLRDRGFISVTTYDELTHELDEIANELHALDWTRNGLEHALANALECTDHDPNTVLRGQLELRRSLEQAHADLTARAETLHEQVLRRLEVAST